MNRLRGPHFFRPDGSNCLSSRRDWRMANAWKLVALPKWENNKGLHLPAFNPGAFQKQGLQLPYPCHLVPRGRLSRKVSAKHLARSHGYGCALKVQNTPLASTPVRGMWARWDLEHRPCEGVHILESAEGLKYLQSNVVGFLHGSPNWQKSKKTKFAFDCAMKFFKGGNCHSKLLRGFSKTKGVWCRSQARKIRRVKWNSWLPICTLIRSCRGILAMPQRFQSSRRGGGPMPSCFLAREKDVQGIPNQMQNKRPVATQCKILYSNFGSKRSCSAKRQISTGKVGIPKSQRHCETRAVPAKSSKANRSGNEPHVKTFDVKGHLKSFLESSALSWPFPCSGETNDSTPAFRAITGSVAVAHAPLSCNDGHFCRCSIGLFVSLPRCPLTGNSNPPMLLRDEADTGVDAPLPFSWQQDETSCGTDPLRNRTEDCLSLAVSLLTEKASLPATVCLSPPDRTSDTANRQLPLGGWCSALVGKDLRRDEDSNRNRSKLSGPFPFLLLISEPLPAHTPSASVPEDGFPEASPSSSPAMLGDSLASFLWGL